MPGSFKITIFVTEEHVLLVKICKISILGHTACNSGLKTACCYNHLLKATNTATGQDSVGFYVAVHEEKMGQVILCTLF